MTTEEEPMHDKEWYETHAALHRFTLFMLNKKVKLVNWETKERVFLTPAIYEFMQQEEK